MLFRNNLAKMAFSSQAKLAASTFRAADLTVTPRLAPKPKPGWGEFLFGEHYTDHMLAVDWSKEGGWEAPQILENGPITVETSATSLHYGISCYESLSIVKNSKTGKLQGFRTQDHLQNLQDSTSHLDLPGFDSDELLGCLKELVKVDRNWFEFNNEID